MKTWADRKALLEGFKQDPKLLKALCADSPEYQTLFRAHHEHECAARAAQEQLAKAAVPKPAKKSAPGLNAQERESLGAYRDKLQASGFARYTCAPQKRDDVQGCTPRHTKKTKKRLAASLRKQEELARSLGLIPN